MNISGTRPTLIASTGISAWPSTLRVGCFGDSSMDDNNTGDLDGTSVSAGITVLYRPSPYTEYSTTGTTTYPVNSGLWTNLAEDYLSQTGVTAVQMIMEAVIGSRFVAHRRNQITAFKTEWTAQGWDPPHVVIFYGMVNDLAANGVGSDGEWSDGEAITEYSVKRRFLEFVYRIRASEGWGDTRILIILPAMENATYPQSDDLRTWLTNAAADIGNCEVVDITPSAVLQDAQHVDADHPTGGSDYISGLVMDLTLV